MKDCLATLAGIGFDCAVNLAGVEAIYLVNFKDVTWGEVDASTGVIKEMTLGTGVKLAEYIPAKNTGSITKTLTKAENTGVRYWTNEIAAQFNHMDEVKRAELDELDGAAVAGFVKDKNGLYWAVGYEQYATITAGTGQTGAAADDGNFYSVTLTDITGARMRAVDATVAKGLVDAITKE